MTFKVLIVGCGAQGKVISAYLAGAPQVDEIRLSDISLETVKQHANRLKSDKVSVHRVDASKINEIASLANGVDVIVNAVIPRFNLNIMDAALKSGVHCLELAFGPPYEIFEKELERSDKFRKVGLTALTGAGSSPGITNVLAAHAADRLDGVNKIRIKLFDMVESKEMFSTWSLETMLGDMAEEPVIYDNGEYKKVPPFSEEEVYNFPEPIGPQTVFAHMHEEALMLPRFIGKGLKYVDIKLGSPDIPLIKSLFQIGLCSIDPIEVKGVKVAPRDVLLKLLPSTLSFEEIENRIKTGTLIDAHECYVVEVEGIKASKKLTYIFNVNFPTLRQVQKMLPGATHESYVTGVSAAIFTEILGEGKIKTKGLIAPECLEQEVREIFLAALAEKSIKIGEQVKSELN